MTTHFIILAAGKGTRMKSSTPKVMHTIGNAPLLDHVLSATKTVSSDKSINGSQPSIMVVLGDQAEVIQNHLESIDPLIKTCLQNEQLGTAHAVCVALESADFSISDSDQVVILFGDTPLVTPGTIKTILADLEQNDLVVAGMYPPDPKQYGRLITKANQNESLNLLEIVEYKHASPDEKVVGLCNSGIMAFQAKSLLSCISKIEKQDLTGEYYLTDAVKVLKQENAKIAVSVIPFEDAEGVNTQQDLALAEHRFQTRKRQQFMTQGVSFQDPNSVFMSHDTILEPDVTIEPNVYFGNNVYVKTGTTIKGFSHLEGCTIGCNTVVGPFARIRPGTTLADNSKVGNFVELKNTHLGEGSKVNHLSYIGDTSVGTKTNIGAGTITCNYDGYQKYKTTIGNNVFVGSNTCFIAPVTVEDNGMTAAGTVVTKSINADDLAVGRTPQKNLVGKAKAFKDQKLKDQKVRDQNTEDQHKQNDSGPSSKPSITQERA